jgi:hypothetical protein
MAPDRLSCASHGYYTLLALKAAGVKGVEIWCVRRGVRCVNRTTIWIDAAIERFGGTTNLLWLARRAKCTQCGAKGCHVQPTEPLAYGMPGYMAEQASGGVKWP